MFDEKKTTLRTHPSLFPLRVALTLALSESPALPPHADANEQRAMQLIARMQEEYKKASLFLNKQNIPASYVFHKLLQEMVPSHAG